MLPLSAVVNGDMMFKTSLWRITACLVLLMAQTAFAQECDPSVKSTEDSSLQYRVRKNRCEGLYDSITSRRPSGLDVVGVTIGLFQFALERKEVIEVSSPIVADQPVNVRVVGIPPQTYFRLDAQLAPGKTLLWPVNDVLLPAKLYASQIGVYGWIGASNGEETYVPVSAVGQSLGSHNDAVIRLILRATENVEKVQWRYADAVGGACETLPSNYARLSQSSYFSGQPITIELPSSGSRELCVDVAASSPSGWLKRLVRVRVGR